MWITLCPLEKSIAFYTVYMKTQNPDYVINSLAVVRYDENTIIGKIEVSTNDNFLTSLDILNTYTVEKKSFKDYMLEILTDYSSTLNSILAYL